METIEITPNGEGKKLYLAVIVGPSKKEVCTFFAKDDQDAYQFAGEKSFSRARKPSDKVSLEFLAELNGISLDLVPVDKKLVDKVNERNNRENMLGYRIIPEWSPVETPFEYREERDINSLVYKAIHKKEYQSKSL
jgi:hypothetical protein